MISLSGRMRDGVSMDRNTNGIEALSIYTDNDIETYRDVAFIR